MASDATHAGMEHSGAARGEPVRVAVGLLVEGPRILVQRRRRGSHLENVWEFPGGRTEKGESIENALRRELCEEIGVEIGRPILFHRESWTYPGREVDLSFFICAERRGKPRPAEEQEIRWVTQDELGALETPRANARVIALLREHLASE